MCPEFMSGALRSHKQTKFSRGAYITAPPKPPAAIMARCARQKVRIRKLRTPPQRDQPTALGWTCFVPAMRPLCFFSPF